MFGTDSFCSLIEDFLSNGFVFRKFNESLSSKSVILRHDIDFSPQYALEIAKLENRLGLSSTFFFLLSSNIYSLASQINRAVVKEIIRLGHSVSLHFDPSVYSDVDKGFKVERDFFEHLFEIKIDTISLHRPGIYLENNNRKLPGVSHTYEDKFFNNMKYISDSGGRDIREQLSEMAKSKEYEQIHLLLHPIWWILEEEDPTCDLKFWLHENSEFLLEETRRNCKTFFG